VNDQSKCRCVSIAGDISNIVCPVHQVNCDPSPEPQRPLTAADTMMRDLAESLRDVLRETDDSYIERDPEDAFVDLAARLVHRLSDKITLVPTTRHKQNEASRRIFDIFTTWMQMQPDRLYVTRIEEASGRFEVTVISPNGIQAYFQGGDVRDAHAQMAQVLLFEGGAI
jgi:hypothetical protein